MPHFMMQNGCEGMRKAYHTATGYECVANHPGNKKEKAQRIMFYARHVVGADGFPYTEIGFSGLYDFEREGVIFEIKSSFQAAGMVEVDNLTNVESDSKCFSQRKSVDDNVSFRVCAGKEGISKIVDVLGKLLLDSSREFVKEQEMVPDVLVESILAYMGSEMDKGPGGHEMAVRKARYLAFQFENGVSDTAFLI